MAEDIDPEIREGQNRSRARLRLEFPDMDDETFEEIFQKAIAVVVKRNDEELRTLDKFYDDEIARLSDKMDGIEPEELEPVIH
jgi:hypothetical protein